MLTNGNHSFYGMTLTPAHGDPIRAVQGDEIIVVLGTAAQAAHAAMDPGQMAQYHDAIFMIEQVLRSVANRVAPRGTVLQGLSKADHDSVMEHDHNNAGFWRGGGYGAPAPITGIIVPRAAAAKIKFNGFGGASVPTGHNCSRCGTHNEYAAPNQPDGSYVCYGCRP